MKRRNILKSIAIGSMGMAVMPAQAHAGSPELPIDESPKKKKYKPTPGRTEAETAREERLHNEQFLTKAELTTLAILCDIIIPADGKSGSATQAGVPDFIEFMMKDMPNMQTPMRGGLRWLDVHSQKKHQQIFSKLSQTQQLAIVDSIAYPSTVKPELSQGANFFSLVRNLTASGFFSSEMGIKDIGYQGNVPNIWEGVPADVLAQYGLEY